MRVVVLLSGGVDSFVVAALAVEAGRDVRAVFVDYDQPARRVEERRGAAYAIARRFPWQPVRLGGVPLGDMRAGTGAHVVPARNAYLLAIGTAWAVHYDADEVLIGCTAEDVAAYPDCRPTFIRAADDLARTYGVRVRAPLWAHTKPMVIDEARRLGITRAETWHCYGPGPEPCGACPCCQRAEAWGS